MAHLCIFLYHYTIFSNCQIPREICICYDGGQIQHTLHDLNIKINFNLFKCVNYKLKTPICMQVVDLRLEI